MKKRLPRPDQVIWMWNDGANAAQFGTFVAVRGSWFIYSGAGKLFRHNGHLLWFENEVNCAWHGYRQQLERLYDRAFVDGLSESKDMSTIDKDCDLIYAAVCGYVRAFADQFKVPASEAWSVAQSGPDRSSNAPAAPKGLAGA